MQRINQEKWQDALNDELASKLTEETVAVLSPSTKIWLITWATQADKPIVLQHLQKGSVDKFALPSEILLDDLFELSEHLALNKELKREMKATIAALRQKIRNMEERQQSMDRAKTMDRMNVLQSAMLAMKEDIEEYQTVAKLAVRNNMDHIQECYQGCFARANERVSNYGYSRRHKNHEPHSTYHRVCCKGNGKNTKKHPERRHKTYA